MAARVFAHFQMQVLVADTTVEMADLAAADAAGEIGRQLAGRAELNVVFAGAESQMEFHRALARRRDIDWPRINAFGVDEFWAPGMPRECCVCEQPQRDLYSHVPVRSVHRIDHQAADPEAERARYEALIRRFPPDIACLGIGRSGHLAFNEPGDSDFADPRLVRVMDVCEQSKRQLMTDPNFKALSRIPEHGITMTVPALLSARAIVCVVPYGSKAEVVRRFFTSPVSDELPATVLKRKPGTRLYLDAESFRLSRDLNLGERAAGTA